MPQPYARLISPASCVMPEIVHTPRLQFRLSTVDNAPAVAEARSESFAALLPWFHQSMGTPEEEGNPEWQSVRLAQCADACLRRERLPYFAWASGNLVGAVDLVPIWRRSQFKLTYWMLSSFARQGYGTEAVNAMTRIAFEAMDARLVTTGHAAPNVASARLAQKLGFRVIARQLGSLESGCGNIFLVGRHGSAMHI